ncbi:MAG TPA: type II toxin-antitoxin system MqsR family toxin [Smithella sp.]|nr:type II toxin-antitoxin system MqsR family toxin [Smithella sp.]
MIPKVREKRKPHYVLSDFKVLFRNESTRVITQIAHKGAVAEGYMTIEDIEGVIDRLCSEHFYKSMTSYANHKVWQDVYKITDNEKKLYIKLQFSLDVPKKAVLIQMKKDEGSDD